MIGGVLLFPVNNIFFCLISIALNATHTTSITHIYAAATSQSCSGCRLVGEVGTARFGTATLGLAPDKRAVCSATPLYVCCSGAPPSFCVAITTPTAKHSTLITPAAHFPVVVLICLLLSRVAQVGSPLPPFWPLPSFGPLPAWPWSAAAPQ